MAKKHIDRTEIFFKSKNVISAARHLSSYNYYYLLLYYYRKYTFKSNEPSVNKKIQRKLNNNYNTRTFYCHAISLKFVKYNRVPISIGSLCRYKICTIYYNTVLHDNIKSTGNMKKCTRILYDIV